MAMGLLGSDWDKGGRGGRGWGKKKKKRKIGELSKTC
jgi:hypothetical protein